MLTVSIIICILSSILSLPHASQDYDVIIMGAGSSGISAAKRLYEAGITNILIIEAQDYIGGRTKIHEIGDYTLNIGASWISATCNPTNIPSLSNNCTWYNETNPMLVAADKYNFSYVLSDWKEHGVILDFGGNIHNKTNSDNRRTKYHKASNCAWEIMQSKKRVDPDDMSYFAALHLCGWTTPLSNIDKTVQWVNYEFDYAAHAKWGTATYDPKVWDSYDRYGPTDVFITDQRGYQGIVLALANEFLDINDLDNEPMVMLNAPITMIEYDDEGVTVTLDDDAQITAKYGIVTFSLGVLQSGIVEFSPELPSWKEDALLATDMADYIPILVKWPYNFWDDQINGNMTEFILLNDGRFGFFTWIYNLDHLNLFNGSLIWRFDVSLDLARLVQDQSLNETIALIIDAKLSHYFDNIPFPEDIVVADWHSNKYVQGSYSFFQVGFDDDTKEAMRWPIDRLYFAGEVLNDFDSGFVHTAWLSGNITANHMLSCLGYDLWETNGLSCQSEYVAPSNGNDCKNNNNDSDSTLTDLIWLWIVLGVLFGIVLGVICDYSFARYQNRKVNTGFIGMDNM